MSSDAESGALRCVEPVQGHEEITMEHFYPYDPNRTPYDPWSSQGLGAEMRNDLMDLFKVAKLEPFGDFGIDLEPEDVEYHLEMWIKSVVFGYYSNHFRSNEPHAVPCAPKVQRYSSAGVLVGVLKKNVYPVRLRAKREDGKRKLGKDALPLPSDKDRCVGAPVYLRAKHRKGTSRIKFGFYDARGRPSTGNPRHILWDTSRNYDHPMGQTPSMHYESLVRHYAAWERDRRNKHNESVAVFFARNRITSWGNGSPVGSRPDGEDFRHFMPAKKIRDLDFDVDNNPDAADGLNSALGRELGAELARLRL